MGVEKRELEEITGIGGHYGGDMETLYNGNSLEPTTVTLTKTPSNGDTEPELEPSSVTRQGSQQWD